MFAKRLRGDRQETSTQMGSKKSGEVNEETNQGQGGDSDCSCLCKPGRVKSKVPAP